MSEEDFCMQKMLENPPEKQCEKCGVVSQFWTDDFLGILCIGCSHDEFCDWANHEAYHADGAYR